VNINVKIVEKIIILTLMVVEKDVLNFRRVDLE
jgi:hypothetical protein